MKTARFLLVCATFAISFTPAQPAPVPLQLPTATYSQKYSGDWSVASTLDADTDRSGWAVQHADGFGQAETAVFETAQDLGFPSGIELTFRLKTRFPTVDGNHNLGRFRLSATTDSRADFADGLDDSGDVEAKWTVLEPVRFAAASGTVLTRLPDQSLLASGPNAETETYTVVVRTVLSGITGFRLETLNDPSLPHGGPGRASNGNFVLVHFSVSAEPPSTPASIRCSAVDVCWEGLLGKLYQVQYTSTLTDQRWVNLGVPVLGSGANCVTDPVPPDESRLYRVIPLD